MNAGECARRMIARSRGNRRDVAHFLKVYAYAKTIAECEGLDLGTTHILELTAIVHDIACPLCREKYGSTNGKLQEKESPALLADFFAGTDVTGAALERIVYLVSHHHTYAGVDGPDWQILLEADYLVNADEGDAAPEAIRAMRDEVFRTETGKELLDAVYQDKLSKN